MERTTNIHKFTVYMYGVNDESLSSIKDAKESIASTENDFITFPYHEKTIEIEDIGDNHELNNINLTKETWEKYMDDELKRLYRNSIDADKELKKYIEKKFKKKED